MKKNNKLEGYKKIYIGVSGGRDSMCLLDYTLKKYPEIRERVIVLNYNYGDQFSNKCEELLSLFCKERKVPLYVGMTKEVHNHSFSSSSGVSGGSRSEANPIGAEDEWRKERYKFFKSIISEEDCLLLGHNYTDQEIFRMTNFLKGSSRCYIPPITKMDGYTLYRPLHNTSREDITEYCKENNIKYGNDPTNPHSERWKVYRAMEDLRETIHQMKGSFRNHYKKYLEKYQDNLMTYIITSLKRS